MPEDSRKPVTWLPAAQRARASQLTYIAERNPRAAQRIGQRLATAVARLADFPDVGRPGRVQGTRELVVPGTPFVVVYRVEAEESVVMRVLHGAQMWPPR